MKKFLLFALAFVFAALPMTMTAKEETHPTKKEIKMAEKSAKNAIKQLKKQGWQFQVSGDPQITLTNHLLKLQEYGGTGTEKIAEANDMRSISLGSTKARQDAIAQYAEEQKVALKGRITQSAVAVNEEQVERLVTAYESRLATELNGDMMLSYVLYRQNKDKKYDVRVHFVVDEVKSKKARMRALEADRELQKLALELGQDISNWINAE